MTSINNIILKIIVKKSKMKHVSNMRKNNIF